MREELNFTVSQAEDGERLDKAVLQLSGRFTRSAVVKWIEDGNVLVGGVGKAKNYRVKTGDEIDVYVPEPVMLRLQPQNIPLDIVYEDDDVLVVNKQAGLVVHPGHGNYSGTLVNALAWHFRDTPNYDVNDPRLGLIHRIDKDTSGLLVVAKTPEAKTNLGLQFFNKTTKRKYIAVVWGAMEQEQGTIEGNIGRDPKDRLRMAVFPPGSEVGKAAVTHWRVMERFGYVTLVECILETGRTHQIRAHMRHEGHPLFGDERYGGTEILRGERTGSYRQFVANGFKLCPRQALHARTLGFVHPRTGRQMDFTSELPADMEQLVDRWRRYMNANNDITTI